MKLILILSLILFLTCKKKEEPVSVEPAKQEQEDTVYYPTILKPCIDGSNYKTTKDFDDLKQCTNINLKDLFGSKEYYSHKAGIRRHYF